MATNRDRYTFQLAEPNSNRSSILAFAEIAANFIRSYRDSKYYDVITSTIIATLFKCQDALSEEALKNIEAALVEQQAVLIQKERERERRPKKWVAKVTATKIDDDSEDDVPVDPEGLEKQRIADEEAQKQLELEWQKNEERYQDLQRQRRENEELLAQKARQVDVKAFEDKLKNGGAVLLNPGVIGFKKGGKKGGPAASQLGEEEIGKLHRDLAEVLKEKERLKTVISISEDELPSKLKEAQQDLAKLKNEAKEKEPFVNIKAKASLSKGQITQLQQKLSKQMVEKNRLALQLKAMEVSEARVELIQVLAERDSILVSMELSNAF